MQNSTQYDDLEAQIAAVEQELRQWPGIFRAKLGLLTLLSCLIIFGCYFLWDLVIVNFGVAIGLVFSNAHARYFEFSAYAAPIVALYTLFTFNPFRAFNQPKGHELTAREYPQLFAEIKQLNQRHKAPRIHKIMLIHSGTAGVSLVSRFTFWGWHQPTLILGLEQLLVMSEEEMRCVLAHEWGHLSGSDEQLYTKTGIVLMYINFLFTVLEKYKSNAPLRLLNWLNAMLNIYVSTLRRHSEYLADATSVSLTDKKIAAESLVKASVFSTWLADYYWEPLFELTRILPNPVASPYKDLQSFLQDYRFTPEELDAKIKQALLLKPDLFASHPSLTERLTAMQATPAFPELNQLSAAEAWFGERFDELITTMDKHWQESYSSGWIKLHQSNQSSHLAQEGFKKDSVGNYFCEKP